MSDLVHISHDSITLCAAPLPAESRIQRGYQRLSSSQTRGPPAGAAGGLYTGILGQLMEKGQLSLDLIKANITELMAGGVDTVCMCVPLCVLAFFLSVSPLIPSSTDSGASAVRSVRTGTQPRGAGEGEAAGEDVMGTGWR